MANQIIPYPLRLEPELRAELERAAKEGGRSLHAEIVRRLEQSVVEGKTDGMEEAPDTSARLTAIEHRLAALEQAMAKKD